MATFVIGDVQGCAATLQRLLDALPLDLAADRLWFAGDLVNRGPASLQALRTVRSLGDAADCVLGNHDLHLLARAAGVARPRRNDTLDDVLGAPDRDELLEWLRSRPLLLRDGPRMIVHAGLLPSWSPEDAVSRARAAEAALRGPSFADFLDAWSRGAARGAAADARAMTSVRMVRADGSPEFEFKGAPDRAPRGVTPWFRARGRRSRGTTVVFGHWAALGWYARPGLLCVDTGCVWGGTLTAVRLDDRRVWSVPAAER